MEMLLPAAITGAGAATRAVADCRSSSARRAGGRGMAINLGSRLFVAPFAARVNQSAQRWGTRFGFSTLLCCCFFCIHLKQLRDLLCCRLLFHRHPTLSSFLLVVSLLRFVCALLLIFFVPFSFCFFFGFICKRNMNKTNEFSLQSEGGQWDEGKEGVGCLSFASSSYFSQSRCI